MKVGITAILAAAALAAGCASSGVSRTDSMMSRLEELSRVAAAARTDIDKVTATLDALVEGKGADPRPLYEQLRGEIGAVASSRANVDSAGQSCRSAMESYFQSWEREANAMQNADIRASSMKRRDDARAKMSAIEPAIAQGKATYDAYVSNLRDIEKLLGADLSPGGIDAASKIIGQSNDEAERTKKSLQALEDAATRIREDLAVRAPPPPAPPAEAPPAEEKSK
jgi:hypothetical protein